MRQGNSRGCGAGTSLSTDHMGRETTSKDSSTESVQLKSPKLGLRPWNMYHSLNSPSHTCPHQLRTRKISNRPQADQAIYQSHVPSRLPVSAARWANRPTLSSRAHPTASRLPRPLNRLPHSGRFHECTMSIYKVPSLVSADGEEGQVMAVKGIQKCQSPVVLPTSPIAEERTKGFSLYPPERDPSALAADVHLPTSSISEVLHHEDISLKQLNQEDAPNVQMPSSPAGLNGSVLLMTSQFLRREEEEEEEAGYVAALSSEDNPETILLADLLPPLEGSSLPAPRPLSESHKHSSDAVLSFPYSNAPVQSSPNSLTKSRIMLSMSPNLPAALRQPLPSSSPAQDLFSADEWSSLREGLALNEPSPISPIISQKDFLEMEEGSFLKQDSISSSDLFDLLETRMVLKEDPLQNALICGLGPPKTAVLAASVIPEVLEEEVSPRSQLSSPVSGSSMEEKVLDSLEEVAAAAAASLGNGSLVFKSLESSVEGDTMFQATPPGPTKHNPCVIL